MSSLVTTAKGETIGLGARHSVFLLITEVLREL